MENAADRSTGVVKWFNSSKGYGFVQQTGNPVDVFVHYTDINAAGYRTLAEGEIISFELSDGPRGPKAVNVRIVDEKRNEAKAIHSKSQAVSAASS